MNNKITNPEIFDHINNLDIQKAQDYFTNGGSVKVVNDKGISPLGVVATKMMTIDVEGYQFQLLSTLSQINSQVMNGNFDNEDEFLSEEQKKKIQEKLHKLALLFIEYGANPKDRIGNTKRTMTIEKCAQRKFPEMYQEWTAMYTQNLIRANVKDQVDSKPDTKKTKLL